MTERKKKLYACRICAAISDGPYCKQHRDNRPSFHRRGYTRKWSKFRAEILRTRRYCEWPEGCSEPATDLHHLDGLGPKGPRGFDPSNLQPLCHRHHSMITQREQLAKQGGG